jgi:hypothetical protein
VATYKELLSTDIKTSPSYLTSIADVIQQNIAGSTSRRKYQNFITGGVGPGVTSSLYQSVYDSDFTSQNSNALLDMTIGLLPSGSTSLTSQTGIDSAGKELFPSSSLMMREKLENYREFASTLLGNSSDKFVAPLDSSNTTDVIDSALFICFKRLIARDQIKRETFAMRFYQTASVIVHESDLTNPQNLYNSSSTGQAIYTDVGSAYNKLVTFGGSVGNIVDSANTLNTVGLMFYDRGIAVFDLAKITSASQFITGTIDAMSSVGTLNIGGPGTETAFKSKFIPDFIVSASIDNIVDHIAVSRFGATPTFTSMTFQNLTNINSSLFFCTLGADEFNYSSNPTFTDDSNRIVVIDPGQEDQQTTFTFVTGVGLYDANDNLLAVGKCSRPIQKSPENSLTLRLKLDF